MPRAPEKKLLVEGKYDKYVIPRLIEANGIKWGERQEERTVEISDKGGYQELLKSGVLETELKASGLRTLGILIDADDSVISRWTAIRHRCQHIISGIPEQLPSNGLIATTNEGIRFGIWILPNNRDAGMMETFLKYLVPLQYDALWQFAQDSATEAKTRGAPYRIAHRDKAEIHTMLAWSDPPGR
jgi:hypothetical protein